MPTVLRLLAAMSCLFVGPALAASPLDGAWRLESGSYLDDQDQDQDQDQEKDYGSLKLQGTKLLADGYFSVTTAQDGYFLADG